MKSLTIILGNQLFAPKFLPKHPIFMCEDMELCQHYRPHKAKIKFFLCAMRDYESNLSAKKHNVFYYKLAKAPQFFKQLKKVTRSESIEKLVMFEIEDKFFEEKMVVFAQKEELLIEFIPSPAFISSRDEFHSYIKSTKKPFMKTFYEEQRRKHNILMDGDKPVGGKYSYDSENRKKLPKKFDYNIPEFKLKASPHSEDIENLIVKYFSDHAGELTDLVFPTDHNQANKFVKYFFKYKIQDFGTYEDAIDSRDPFLFHSLFSPLLNIGLLTPMQVVKEAQKSLDKDNLNSVEGFIRQVMGWREFMRGIYQNFDQRLEQENFFGHTKKLKKCWYDATTEIPVVDSTIKKVLKYGYCHHIERLMILSNLMLLLEVHPKQVYSWFMEMFVDSLDWVMAPNVYGMGQFSDGGIFATKPYFSGSNYIIKMSHEKKGDWSDEWDGLYWQFIERNREFFAKNYRLSMMVKMLDKMDADKKKKIFQAADRAKKRLVS